MISRSVTGELRMGPRVPDLGKNGELVMGMLLARVLVLCHISVIQNTISERQDPSLAVD